MTRVARRPLASRVLRWLAVLLGLALVTVLGLLSCSSFEHELSPAQERCVRRFSYAAPTGPVAAIAGGPADAPRVLFVHGSPGSASDWAAYLVDPPAGHEAVAIDRPGFGKSAPSGAVSSLELQADALAPLLVQRDGRWPIVVGHSLGAPIAARLAADHPDEVGGLLLLAGAMDPALEDWRWYNRVATALSPLLARPLRNSNDELRPLAGELAALAPDLARIRCPVVVVHGRKDALVPFAEVDYARRRLSTAGGLRVIELPDGDHFLPWDASGVVRDAIDSLVRP